MIAYHGTRSGRLKVGDYLDPEQGIFRPGFASASLDRSMASYFADPERPAILTIELDDRYRGQGWAVDGDPLFEEIELPEWVEAGEAVIWKDGVARVIKVERS